MMAAHQVADDLAGLSVNGSTDGGVIAELRRRHGHSAQPSSQQTLAVLQAVLGVLQAEGMPCTPTTMFGAIMMALEQPETQQAAETCLAMCTVLSSVLGRVPNGVLRAKFMGATGLLVSVIQQHKSQAPTLKAALQCLGQLLAAMDPGNWPASAAPWALLLSFLTDARPKVRKRALASAQEVLGALQGTPALAQSSEAVMAVCTRVLPGPEAAAKAAAAAPGKQRSTYEAAITQAVSDALHLLSALKQLGPLMAPPSLPPMLDLLFKLLPLRQALLSRAAFDTMTAVMARPGSPLAPGSMASLLDAALAAEGSVDRRQPEALLALARLLEEGLVKLAAADPVHAAPRLASACHFLVPLLGAEQDGTRFSASQVLQRLMREALTDAVVSAPPASGQGLPPVQSVVAAVGSALGARYQESWPLALPVVGALLERLGSSQAQLATPLLQQLGGLCSGAFEAEEEEGQPLAGPGPSSSAAAAAEAVLGSALCSLGPEAVLGVLPLNLKEGLMGTAEPRTWLLPLLRRHVRGANLAYWSSNLLPLAKQLGSKAASASQAGQKLLALNCHTLELQLWSALPAFCSWLRDCPTAYPACVQELAAAAQNREDLRASVCAALVRLCLQARQVLADAGRSDLVGFAAPVVGGEAGRGDGQEDEDDDHPDAGPGPGSASLGTAPEWFTADVAAANVAALRQYSRNWLPLLFKLFLASSAEGREPLGGAIAAYTSISEPGVVSNLFKAAMTKLLRLMAAPDSPAAQQPPVLDGGSTDTERIGSFLELCLALGAGLDDAGLNTLWAAAKPHLTAREALLQKKAYKVAAYLVEGRPQWLASHLGDLLQALLVAGPAAMSAAKRFRLRCLKPIILLLQSQECPPLQLVDEAGKELLPGGAEASDEDAGQRTQAVARLLVAELVLGTKEANTRSRAAAYDLLVATAHALDGAADDSDDEYGGMGGGRPGLMSLVHMIAAGLVGTTPHMMSASVLALARLLFEFGGALEQTMPQMLPACLLLLRSKSRELVKSVLGLLKVAAMRLPVDMLTPLLPQILEGILLWAADSRNKFKLKVRRLVERLAKRCGYDAVAAVLPEEHAKLLTHIRKAHNRKERLRAASQAGSEMGDEPDEARSVRSASSRGSLARTARASEWGHTAIFSSDDDSDGEGPPGTRRARSVRSAAQTARTAATKRGGAAGAAGRLADRADEPLDLLDAGTSRQLARSAAGQGPRRHEEGMGDDFQRDPEGRLMIRDEEAAAAEKALRKRKRGADGYDSDDSDFDDLRGIAGLDAAMRAAGKARSVRFAQSVGGTSVGGKSRASQGSMRSRASGKSAVSNGKAAQHSGDRFKPKKSGTGGDTKGKQAVEPYAYWQMDRRMLNRRRGKQASASKGLGKLVTAAQAGALKGAKAKRAAQASKRARR